MKMKKSLFGALLLVSACSALAGCGGGVSYDAENFLPNGTSDNPYQIVKNPVTIKIFAPHSSGNPEYKDLKMFKKLSELTNLQFEFTTPDTSAYQPRRAAVWEDGTTNPTFSSSTTRFRSKSNTRRWVLTPLPRLTMLLTPMQQEK